MFGGAPAADPKKLDRLREVLGWVNDFLKPTGYVAGTQNLTIADIVFVGTYSTIVACEGMVDLTPYKELNAWFEKMKKELPNYKKANEEGVAMFGGFYKKAN